MRLNGVQKTTEPSTRIGVVWVELLAMRSVPRRFSFAGRIAPGDLEIVDVALSICRAEE